jgi:hypothetical protein
LNWSAKRPTRPMFSARQARRNSRNSCSSEIAAGSRSQSERWSLSTSAKSSSASIDKSDSCVRILAFQLRTGGFASRSRGNGPHLPSKSYAALKIGKPHRCGGQLCRCAAQGRCGCNEDAIAKGRISRWRAVNSHIIRQYYRPESGRYEYANPETLEVESPISPCEVRNRGRFRKGLRASAAGTLCHH